MAALTDDEIEELYDCVRRVGDYTIPIAGPGTVTDALVRASALAGRMLTSTKQPLLRAEVDVTFFVEDAFSLDSAARRVREMLITQSDKGRVPSFEMQDDCARVAE